MKTIIFLIIASYFCLSLYPQKVIDNSKKSLKNTGKMIKLEEKIKINDKSEDFYFKYPSNLKIAPDGCIFMLDKDEFLKFSQEGKFIKNLFKKGIGPGEFLRIENFIFYKDRIIAHQTQPNKIVEMDLDGKLLKETKPATPVSKLLTYYDGKYYVLRNSFSQVSQEKMNIIDVKYDLAVVSEDGKVENCGLSFPVKWFGRKIGGGIMANYITDFFYAVYKEKYLVVYNTQEYLLKIIDLNKKEITRSFKRDYESVKFIQGDDAEMEAPRDYFNDIQKILVHNDEIWLFTSTFDPAKGIATDVFDIEGKYLDYFYFPLPKNIELKDIPKLPTIIDGDYIFSIRPDENDSFFIVKHQIIK